MQQHEALKAKRTNSLNILKHNKAMKNQAPNQKSILRNVAPSVASTIIPIDYDPSVEGFNHWAIEIKNQVHVGSRFFDDNTIVPEANRILQFHTPIKR